MASKKDASKSLSLFTSEGLQWSSEPLVFDNNYGKNIRLSQEETVATRVGGTLKYGPAAVWPVWGRGIVYTKEPVPVGKMFKVTVTERYNEWLLDGLGMGLTGNTTNLHLSEDILEYKYENGSGYIYLDSHNLNHEDKHLCQLDFSTYDLSVGQSLGILLTRDRDLHWFVDDKWRGMVHVDDYPIDKPVWGVVDVCSSCKEVKAEICSVSGYDSSFEEQLINLGVVASPQAIIVPQSEQIQPSSVSRLAQLLEEGESIKNQIIAEKNRHDNQILTLQEQISHEREVVRDLQSANQRLLEQIEDLTTRRTEPSVTAVSHEVEFWQVSPEEVSIREDQILGRGAWGYVAKGIFRGTAVAVKRVYPEILEQTTLDRICREIRTMAQIRHPNLVLFIVAVVNEHTGPMIVTELLDISLRQAYQANRVGTNKRKIFRDISSALSYLHQQREPIIHRDVSTANILLTPLPNDTWLAKLSDFGSANLARDATTPGEGAILYTAPEAFPHHPSSPIPPPPQTTKIDVYSFGVVACEVVTQVFPESNKFAEMIEGVSRKWPKIHPLVVSCVSRSPQDRPTMVTVLDQLQELNNEPVS